MWLKYLSPTEQKRNLQPVPTAMVGTGVGGSAVHVDDAGLGRSTQIDLTRVAVVVDAGLLLGRASVNAQVGI